MTSASPVYVNFEHRADPIQRISLAIRIESGDLLRHPPSNGARPWIRDEKTQLAYAPFTPAPPHHLHSFGR